MTTIPPNILWDEDSWHAISARNLKEARDAGALARLPIHLADPASLRAESVHRLPKSSAVSLRDRLSRRLSNQDRSRAGRPEATRAFVITSEP
jgi:hypothetical protein